MPDQIPGNEEVGRKAHIADSGQLVCQTLHDPVLELVPPPFSGPLKSQMLEVGVGTLEALGNRKVGQARITELDFHPTPLGNPQRVVAGIG